jgi:peptide/nickel transport system permease protein
MNTQQQPVRTLKRVPRSPGYWQDVWRRFRRKLFPMLGLAFIGFLVIVAVFAPAIAGTKPVVCEYKGTFYFPALGYLNTTWENPIFRIDKFRGVYPENLTKNDPKAWAVWPLVYQDPYRRVRANEWPGLPAAEPLMPPDRYHLFGTDPAGVDVFAKMVHGTRTALVVGFISMGIAAIIGITLGAIAGYFGGWIDSLVSRLIEVVMCIPTLILILALIAVVERPTIWHMMAIIGFTGWTGIARLTRGEFLRLRNTEFVLAAISLGIRRPTIIFRHVLPNAMAPVLVPITFGIAAAILIEASLSFLGFGAPPPNPSWGTILDAGRANLSKWWLVTFPGVAILFTVLSYNLVGEGLQEATDPRLRDGRA